MSTSAGSSSPSLSELGASCFTVVRRKLPEGKAIELIGLPGRMLKLMLDGEPVVPSSYSFRAASYSSFSCSAWARNGCD